jgi:hypothetical protein
MAETTMTRWTNSKDVNKLLDEAQAHGAAVSKTRRGHFLVQFSGCKPIFVASTPRNSVRAAENSATDMTARLSISARRKEKAKQAPELEAPSPPARTAPRSGLRLERHRPREVPLRPLRVVAVDLLSLGLPVHTVSSAPCTNIQDFV